MPQNLATVRAIYDAFGRGDVPGILEHLAEDVEWEVWHSNSAQEAGVPWMQARHGRDKVVGFFEVVGGFQFKAFDVLAVAGGADRVIVELEVDIEFPGGGAVRDEEIHLWTFNAEGRVKRFRHYLDTAKHIAASRGQDTREQQAGA